MITLTVEQLVSAALSGAYNRFASIRKTITAGHKNRKTPKAFVEECKIFDEQKEALIKECEGEPIENGYTFKGDNIKKFNEGLVELQKQTVELPGEQIKISDLLDGGLLETDYELLAPFLSE